MTAENHDLLPPVNHVFVDFENVHDIDPRIIGARTVHLILLMGSRQTKLDAALVEKLLQHAATVELIRLKSSGRNALDFTLAYYLGRAVLADPCGYFHIVSKDAGYDPLIEHLRSRNIGARRHNDFAALTFLDSVEAPASALPPTTPMPKPSGRLKPGPLKAAIVDEREQRVLEHFRKPTTTRPRTKTRLLSFLMAYHANKMTEGEALGLVENLNQAGHLGIDAKDKITYHLGPA